MTRHAPRRRRRWPLRLAIVLLVLLGLAVAADRVSVRIAEAAVARTLQNSQNLTHQPDVSIDGFPFLTQLARGTFDRVELSDDDVTVGQNGRTVSLERLKLTLHRVKLGSDFKHATAQTGTADARLSYAALSRTLGTELSYAGAGKLKASGSVVVGGQSITGSVTATPQLSGGALQFAAPQVSVDGAPAPAAVTSALAGVFGPAISLANLPYRLVVQSLSVKPDGIALTLSAGQLNFRR